MPIYEFACSGCGDRFERLQSLSAEEPACPSCGGTTVTRLISLIAGLPRSGSGNGVMTGGGCACGGRCACGR